MILAGPCLFGGFGNMEMGPTSTKLSYVFRDSCYPQKLKDSLVDLIEFTWFLQADNTCVAVWLMFQTNMYKINKTPFQATMHGHLKFHHSPYAPWDWNIYLLWQKSMVHHQQLNSKMCKNMRPPPKKKKITQPGNMLHIKARNTHPKDTVWDEWCHEKNIAVQPLATKSSGAFSHVLKVMIEFTYLLSSL